MSSWQITATTIYCDAVDDEVTLLVMKNGTARCTGVKKYTEPTPETQLAISTKSKKLGRRIACRGGECGRAADYRNKLIAEGNPDK